MVDPQKSKICAFKTLIHENKHVILYIEARDLSREFLLSLCLVLSVIAVLTPILLLASVKVGFIDRLRQDFIQDPVFPRNSSWFRRFAK